MFTLLSNLGKCLFKAVKCVFVGLLFNFNFDVELIARPLLIN